MGIEPPFPLIYTVMESHRNIENDIKISDRLGNVFYLFIYVR